ncbi:MAG TPA: hypothetical protein DCR40_21760 [Prolixibacteraceae bacterium]|nr:hypothetical protein [Prolixibacteraceae bacterium]
MKTFRFILLLTLFIPIIGMSQTNKNEVKAASSNQIEAYYFHNTYRCITCKTVEAEAKADLQSLYGSQVTFKALNLEDDATKAIAKKLEVSGQTLLLVKGDQKINITNEGFLYARSNPVKFKMIIKEKVDKLLE